MLGEGLSVPGGFGDSSARHPKGINPAIFRRVPSARMCVCPSFRLSSSGSGCERHTDAVSSVSPVSTDRKPEYRPRAINSGIPRQSVHGGADLLTAILSGRDTETDTWGVGQFETAQSPHLVSNERIKMSFAYSRCYLGKYRE